MKSQKSYIDEKYGVEEAEKEYAEWDRSMQQPRFSHKLKKGKGAFPSLFLVASTR